MSRIETPNRDALLKLLVLGRVDSVMGSRRLGQQASGTASVWDSRIPILYDAERLDLEGEARPLYPPLASTPTYLLFSQAPGNQELSQQFSEALKAYKLTPEYAEIRETYGF